MYFALGMNRKILQTRLIKFEVMATALTDSLKPNMSGRNMAWQLVRSSTSPALNYAESQSAESTRDFVHKLTIGLKELREAAVCLRIIEEAKLCDHPELLTKLTLECSELEAIFVSSINTVKQNSDLRSET